MFICRCHTDWNSGFEAARLTCEQHDRLPVLRYVGRSTDAYYATYARTFDMLQSKNLEWVSLLLCLLLGQRSMCCLSVVRALSTS